MKLSMRNRLEQLAHRLIEVDALLAEPNRWHGSLRQKLPAPDLEPCYA